MLGRCVGFCSLPLARLCVCACLCVLEYLLIFLSRLFFLAQAGLMNDWQKRLQQVGLVPPARALSLSLFLSLSLDSCVGTGAVAAGWSDALFLRVCACMCAS